MLFLIGLGLGDERDISVRGLDIVRECHTVFLETYTSVLCSAAGVGAMEQLYGRPVVPLTREQVEGVCLSSPPTEGAVAALSHSADDKSPEHMSGGSQSQPSCESRDLAHNNRIGSGDQSANQSHVVTQSRDPSDDNHTESRDIDDAPPTVHQMLRLAKRHNVALLVIGDPFCATTHHDIALRAHQQHVPVRVVHNASIVSAVACCGLQLYTFGETVSIPFWSATWRPTSFLERIDANLARGLHTLCLLDIRVREPSDMSLARGRPVYQPPRYMSAAQAGEQLLTAVTACADRVVGTCLTARSTCVVVCRVGAPDQRIVSCALERLPAMDCGPPLHSLVVVGKMHPLEEEFLSAFSL